MVLAMMNKEMTRKEFLGSVAAFLGVLILSRIPFQGAAKHLGKAKQDSYGGGILLCVCRSVPRLRLQLWRWTVWIGVVQRRRTRLHDNGSHVRFGESLVRGQQHHIDRHGHARQRVRKHHLQGWIDHHRRRFSRPRLGIPDDFHLGGRIASSDRRLWRERQLRNFDQQHHHADRECPAVLVIRGNTARKRRRKWRWPRQRFRSSEKDCRGASSNPRTIPRTTHGCKLPLDVFCSWATRQCPWFTGTQSRRTSLTDFARLYCRSPRTLARVRRHPVHSLS